MTDTTSDDAALVRSCLAGDQRGYARLLERHRGRVFGFLLRLVGDASDAEDLAQTVFLKAFRALDSYDPARAFHSWLFGIAHHAALDFLRARRPREASLDDADAAYDAADEAPGPELSTERSLDGALIERLLAALPPLYREVLVLRHVEDMSVEGIAAALGMPEGTVKIRLFRARELMRRKWEAFGDEKNETRSPRTP